MNDNALASDLATMQGRAYHMSEWTEPVILRYHALAAAGTREKPREVAELIIAKQRNGPVGKVRLKFCKEFACFEDWTDNIVRP